MLEKIVSKSDKKLCIDYINNSIKPVFAQMLDDTEMSILLYDINYDNFEGKEVFFYKNNTEIVGIVILKCKTEKIVYISEFHIFPNFQ